jgi:CBS-domain-containing membrane protein
MTTDVQVLQPRSDLYDAARVMRASGIRSLPVVDAGRVVGVVSRSDLLRVLAREDDEVLRDLEQALTAELGPHHDLQISLSAGVVTVTGGGAGASAAAAVVAAASPGWSAWRRPGSRRRPATAVPGRHRL